MRNPENDEVSKIHRKNLSAVQEMLSTQQTEGTYSTWLLNSVSNKYNAWFPLRIDPKAKPLTYLLACMEELSMDDQAITKTAITHAIGTWDSSIHEPYSLKDLSFFALYTDSRTAIEKIGEKVKEQAIDDPEINAALIAVISGFSHYELLAPMETLLQLYEEEDLHPEFTPNLAIAIASITPSEYPSFLERFLSYEEYYKSTREPEFVDNALRSFIEQTMEMHGEQEAWEIIQSRFSTLPVDIVLRLQTQYDKIMQDIEED